jgi:carbonic anhydrase
MTPGIDPVLGQPGDVEANAVRANVEHSVERLRNAPPVLADLVSRGELGVIGGIYDLATGRVELGRT